METSDIFPAFWIFWENFFTSLLSSQKGPASWLDLKYYSVTSDRCCFRNKCKPDLAFFVWLSEFRRSRETVQLTSKFSLLLADWLQFLCSPWGAPCHVSQEVQHFNKSGEEENLQKPLTPPTFQAVKACLFFNIQAISMIWLFWHNTNFYDTRFWPWNIALFDD